MLTERMRETLGIIECFHDLEGRSPFYSEIMEELGITAKSRVNALIKSLCERGYLWADPDYHIGSRNPDDPRSMRVLKPFRAPIPIYRASDNQLMGFLP